MSKPVQQDPLRGLRGIFVGVLVMEAIVVGLALLVVGRLGAGLGGPAGLYTGALALAMIIAAGAQRFSWGLGLALALQIAMVAGWFAHPALGALGLLFVLVWGYLLYVRSVVAQRSTNTRPLTSSPRWPLGRLLASESSFRREENELP